MKTEKPASLIALIESLPAHLRAQAYQYAEWESDCFFNQQLDASIPVWDVELYDKRAWESAELSVYMRFVEFAN